MGKIFTIGKEGILYDQTLGEPRLLGDPAAF
jgi:hypothetical protein